MSDLIERQAAIEAMSSMFAPTPTQKDMVEDCLEIIENLPSAQPDIDIEARIDKAWDSGYAAGYSQAKHDWE